LKRLRQELNLCTAGNNLHKIDTHENKEGIVISGTANNLFGSQDDNNKLSASILKLKIRNTTEYLKTGVLQS
jgi:hypothetical protein